jgi:hypothetical protein
MILGGGIIHKNEIPVYQFNLDGNLLNKFSSITKASEYLGVDSSSNISIAIRSKKSYRNYFWNTEDSINI